ncbi:MAG: aminotransferase class IV, partial [Planctomycetia bacterium]
MSDGAGDPFSLVWVDGAVRPVDEFRLSPFDPGLQFGLGLFETTRTVAGRPWRWDEHLARLKRSAGALRMTVGPLPTAEEAAAFAACVMEASAAVDVVLRLNASAGGAGAPPRVWATARALPPATSAVALTASPYRISHLDPFASHKAFNYGLRHFANAQAAAQGFDDALLLDTRGRVLEASRANLFVRLTDGWATPAVGSGVLPGVARGEVLRRW